MNKEENDNLIENPSDGRYYGVKNQGGNAGFIVRSAYESGPYKVYCTDALTMGNGWNNIAGKTLKSTIAELQKRNFTVKEFPSFKKLVAWLTNNKQSV
jgi:hypothetical protein